MLYACVVLFCGNQYYGCSIQVGRLLENLVLWDEVLRAIWYQTTTYCIQKKSKSIFCYLITISTVLLHISIILLLSLLSFISTLKLSRATFEKKYVAWYIGDTVTSKNNQLHDIWYEVAVGCKPSLFSFDCSGKFCFEDVGGAVARTGCLETRRVPVLQGPKAARVSKRSWQPSKRWEKISETWPARSLSLKLILKNTSELTKTHLFVIQGGTFIWNTYLTKN